MDYTSASQIETWEGCLRKGAWKYVAGIEAPQHPAAALGTEIDDEQLQPFLREGRAFDFSRPSGEIAQSIAKYLPPAGSCPETELGIPRGIGKVQQWIDMPSPTWVDGKHCGLAYRGALDLWLPLGGIELPEGVPVEVNGIRPPAVVDFKSTGDLKWAKSETTLATDVQAQTYALWGMYKTRSPVVDLVWLYMRTKGARQGKRVHLRVYAEDVAKTFSDIDERARRIHALKITNPDPLSLPPTPEHCDAYGGCPYRDRCNLGPGEIADAAAANAKRRRGEEVMSETKIGFMEALRLKREAAGGQTPAAAPVQAPAAAPPAPQPNPTLQEAVSAMVPGIVVGINPPEKDLPPAPPVGETKRGPGRPAKQLTIPGSEGNGATRVRVVWGKEKIAPIPYNDFEVGPFEAEGVVLPGETVPQACGRVYVELSAFAESVRASKALSFARALGSK